MLSTDQNGAPSAEPEISGISSHHSSSALHGLAMHQQKEPCEQRTRLEQEEDGMALECPEQLIEIEAIDEDDEPEDAPVLPPSTMKYALVLDLDETLIHSHVQYKKMFTTR